MLFILSTNLAIPGIGEKARKVADMMTKDDVMVISISGLTQDVYEINHKGGRIEKVIENLNELAKTSGYKKNIILRLLQFDYNVGEIPGVIELTKKWEYHIK